MNGKSSVLLSDSVFWATCVAFKFSFFSQSCQVSGFRASKYTVCFDLKATCMFYLRQITAQYNKTLPQFVLYGIHKEITFLCYDGSGIQPLED
jgi:hypothetical protein